MFWAVQKVLVTLFSRRLNQTNRLPVGTRHLYRQV